MLLTAFLPYSNERFRHNHAVRRRQADNRRRHILRPRLQLLEDRTLLSTFTVTDNSDSSTDKGSLRYAILHEPGGTTIDFASTVTSPITLTNGPLKITKGLDIQGPAAGSLTINGNNASTVFSVAAGVTATISGLTIAHGSASIFESGYLEGGGIYNDGTLAVTGVTISSNSAGDGGYGGGIFNDGTLTVTDSTLSSNNAMAGGGIANGGTLTVTDSTLSNNSAGNDGFGGGISNVGELTVTDCTLSSNSTSGFGGGIANAGGLTITGSTLSSNKADSGGAVCNTDRSGTLANCTLSGNSASGPGGGIAALAGSLVIADCTVSNNSAEDGGGFDNTADGAGGRVYLANTIVAGNMLTGSGGSGPDVHGVAYSLGCNLIGSSSGSSGWVSTDLTGTALKPLTPKLAPLGNYGGPTETMALMQGSPALGAGTYGVPDLTVPTLDQRGAIRGPNGLGTGEGPDIGAFEASSSYLVTTAADSNDVGTLRTAVGWANVNANNSPENLLPNPAEPNTIIFDASATGAFGTPRTITLSASLGTLNLTNATTPEAIDGPGRAVVTVGGGNHVQVFSVGTGVSVTIAGLTIAHGSSSAGGGIDNYGTLTVSDSTLSSNSASNLGGAIVNEGKLTVKDSTLSSNEGKGSGGGIYNFGTLTITDSTLSRNSANAGGGIYNDGTLTISDSTLSSNSANTGGGIYNEGKLTAVTDSTLSSNQAGFGGGIYNDGKLTVTGSTLSSNQATSGAGAGVDNIGGSATLTNCSLSGNLAGKYGGAIYNDAMLTVTDSTLSRNKAGDFGGGIDNDSLGTLTVTDSTLSSNSAEDDGGGIYNDGKLTVTDSTLSSDKAVAGGGVYNTHGSASLTNCTLSGNSASGAGGGIDALSGGLTLTSCTVSNNSAKDGGGIENTAVGASGTVTLANTIVAGNTLTGSGGSGPDVFGKVISLGFNLLGSNSGSSGWVSTDLQNRNPLLAILGNYGGPTQTMALLPGSPALGTGSASIPAVTLPTTDQRGDPRTTSGALDIGAFQSHGFKIIVSSGNNQSTAVNTAFAAPLVVRVTSTTGEPVAGGFVTFTAPASGASAIFPSGINTVEISGSDLARIKLSANTIAGGPYAVQATTDGAAAPVHFSLTNSPGADDQLVVYTEATTTATAGLAFNSQPVFRLTEQDPPFALVIDTQPPTVAVVGEPFASQQAIVTATANSIVGSFVVTATDSADSGLKATFVLSN